MILIEVVSAVLLLAGSALILRAVIASDVPEAGPAPAEAQELPPTEKRAA